MPATNEPSSIVWVSGATEGIGLGLARNVPFANARIINLSRRHHPDLESVRFDLARPDSWDAVGEHFHRVLSGFRGERALFFQNAHLKGLTGFVGDVAEADYRRDLTANLMAPLAIAELFLRAVFASGYAGEAGLIMLSSATARTPYEGQSVYCAGKAALEMWVRVVRRELRRRGRDRVWATAVRPGFVDTATTRLVAALDEDTYPASAAIASRLASGEAVLDIDAAARQIWAALPADRSLLSFGEQARAPEAASPNVRSA